MCLYYRVLASIKCALQERFPVPWDEMHALHSPAARRTVGTIISHFELKYKAYLLTNIVVESILYLRHISQRFNVFV